MKSIFRKKNQKMGQVCSRLGCAMVCTLLFTSCADLKGINKFAAGSSTVILQPYPYSYYEYCFDSCYIYDNSTALAHYPCDCSIALNYDSSVAREAAKLSNYFKALAALSGSAELIKVDTISGVVTAGTYGSFRISDTEAAVVSGLATAIQDLLTVRFKSNHLTSTLREYGGAVDTALISYSIHLVALDGQMENLGLYLKTQLLLYRRTAPPGPERFAVVAAYNQKMADLAERHVRFQTLLKQIQLLHDGYRQLLANASDIKSKTLKKNLLALVANISYIQ